MNRRLNDDDIAAIRTAGRSLINRAGGQEAAARQTRLLNHQTLSAATVPHAEENRHLAVDVVADIEDYVGEPIVSRFLVERLGYAVFKVPEGGGQKDLQRLSARMVREFGEALSAHAAAIEGDDIVEPDEARVIAKEVRDLISAAGAFEARLNQIIETGEGGE